MGEANRLFGADTGGVLGIGDLHSLGLRLAGFLGRHFDRFKIIAEDEVSLISTSECVQMTTV